PIREGSTVLPRSRPVAAFRVHLPSACIAPSSTLPTEQPPTSALRSQLAQGPMWLQQRGFSRDRVARSRLWYSGPRLVILAFACGDRASLDRSARNELPSQPATAPAVSFDQAEVP